VIKRAQIVFGDSVLDCTVLDLSPAGARAGLAATAAVPGLVTMRFRDGVSRPAHRRWSRGAEVGFEFTGAGPAAADAGRRGWVEAIRRAFGEADPAEAMRLLRAAGFLGDEELRRAAEVAELAHAQLAAALRAHEGGIWAVLDAA
jgi:hypothetical protein